jgi:hypothetical protein
MAPRTPWDIVLEFFGNLSPNVVILLEEALVRRTATAATLTALIHWPVTAYAGPRCDPGGSYSAVDISYQVNDTFLKRIKSIGVSTIIRYYDWVKETLHGKTLTETELAMIRNNALNVAVVFQHHNDSLTTFETAGRGVIDAKGSLDLAKHFKRLSGSAIYFGVDGVDEKFFGGFANGTRQTDDKFGIQLIKRYLKEIGAEFRRQTLGYAIGVYGSGLVCREILNAGLAKYCWLANATSGPEYDSFEKTGRWNLKQFLPTKSCFGEEVDLNVIKRSLRDFGQWRP